MLFLNTIGIMDELDEVVTKLRALLARERALLVEERKSLVKERAVLQASKHAFQKEMADARRAFEAEKAEMVKISARASDVIDLNVGGHAMSVLRCTLCAVEGSMLACMFSGRWDQQLTRDAQGRVFLDYNAYCFERIVDCLRHMALVDGKVLVPTVSADLIPTMLTLVQYLGLDKIMPVATSRWKEHAGISVFDNGVVLADKEAHSAFAILHDAFQVGKHTWHVSMDSGGNTQVGVIPVNEVSSCYKSSSLFRMGVLERLGARVGCGPRRCVSHIPCQRVDPANIILSYRATTDCGFGNVGLRCQNGNVCERQSAHQYVFRVGHVKVVDAVLCPW